MRSLSLTLLGSLALLAPSCTYFQKQNADPYGQQQPSANPYGEVPQSNPYATPPASPYGSPAAGNPYAQQPTAPSNPYATGGGGYEQAQTYPYTAPSSSSYSSSQSPYSGGGSSGGGGGGGEVTVQPGDNLTKIAKRNGTSVSALKSANGLTTDFIRAGQKLKLP